MRSAIGFAIFALSAPIAAQSYVPDLLELDGTVTLQFPADDRMALEGGATIEFWVQPDWKSDPGYDPVILSNAGEEGALYLVAIAREKDGLGIMSGDLFEMVPFDFTDGKLHHVNITDYGDTMLVFVDGVLISELPLTFKKRPSKGFWIGSADGENDLFVGAIAGLRIWDIPVDADNVLDFMMAPIAPLEGKDHPDLKWLVGASDFQNTGFLLQPYADK
jgi:hypothetical protein